MARPRDGDHVVQFYRSEDEYPQRMGAWIHEGLVDGDGILAVVTQAHENALLAFLQASGCNPDAALARGRLKFLDASRALSMFFSGGPPTVAMLEKHVKPLLDSVRAASRNGRVRAFGEVVSLLARVGRTADAVHLERTWGRAQDSLEFSLLCAYRLADFPRASDHKAFCAVCSSHDRVLPALDEASISDSSRVAAQLARLEQLAGCAELEAALRADRERELRTIQRAIALPSSFPPGAAPSPIMLLRVQELLSLPIFSEPEVASLDLAQARKVVLELRAAAIEASELLGTTTVPRTDLS
ncbi:MAG: MEDS domain-containing protein [Myxococcales bacterium]